MLLCVISQLLIGPMLLIAFPSAKPALIPLIRSLRCESVVWCCWLSTGAYKRTRHSGWRWTAKAVVLSFESIRSRIDRTSRRESIPTLNDKNIRSHRTFYHNLDWCSRAEIGKARVKVNDVNQYQSPAAGITEFWDRKRSAFTTVDHTWEVVYICLKRRFFVS